MEDFSAIVKELPRTAVRSVGASRVLCSAEALSTLHVVVEDGVLAVTAGLSRGNLMVVDLVLPNTCFGLVSGVAPFSGEQWDLVALTPATALLTPMGDYLLKVRADHRFAALAAWSKTRHHSITLQRNRVLQIAAPVARLAGMLSFLARQAGTVCSLAGGRFFPLSQRWLAAVTQLSRQATNRVIGRLQEARLVHVERKFVCVLDPAALDDVASGLKQPAPLGAPTACKLRHPLVFLNCVTADPVAR